MVVACDIFARFKKQTELPAPKSEVLRRVSLAALGVEIIITAQCY